MALACIKLINRCSEVTRERRGIDKLRAKRRCDGEGFMPFDYRGGIRDLLNPDSEVAFWDRSRPRGRARTQASAPRRRQISRDWFCAINVLRPETSQIPEGRRTTTSTRTIFNFGS